MFQTAITFSKDLVSKVPFPRGRFGIRTILAIALVLLGLAVIIFTQLGSTPEEEPVESTRSVSIATVASLTRGGGGFSTVGTVQSETEASILTEASGNVTGVYYELGDYVYAGNVIAEIENAAQRAAVLQATGVRDAAQAQLDKVKKGTRAEQLATLESSLRAAQSTGANTLLSAYAAIDDATLHGTDIYFSNPQTYNPSFLITLTDIQLRINAETKRAALNDIEAVVLIDSTNTAEISAGLDTAYSDVLETRAFLDTTIAALDKAVPSSNYSASSIATAKSTVVALRTSITAMLGTISQSRNSLTSASLALEQGISGAEPEDIAAAEAQLTQARGSLASAYAALSKTTIRSPISGTLNSLSVKRGTFVQAFSPAAVVANNNALEVVVYVTETDAQLIRVGESVRVNKDAEGVITRVAPALDPLTQKIEVRIGITETASLINGTTATIAFTPTESDTAVLQELIVPLTALKLSANEANVFFVDENSKLVSMTVELGTLLGDRAVITSGLSADDTIVIDARGLHNGQTVIVE